MKKSTPNQTSLIKSVVALFLITGIAAIATSQGEDRGTPLPALTPGNAAISTGEVTTSAQPVALANIPGL